jgi:diguanylate cyclase
MPARIENHPQPAVAMAESLVKRPWLLTILLASALCLAYLLGSVVHWGDAADRSLYANLGMIPIGLAATLLAAEAARSESARTSIWAWGMLAAGLACFWAGDVLYFVYQNVFGVTPFPSLADAGYLAYYPLAFVGLLLLPSRPAHRLRRIVTYPGCLVLMVGGAAAIVVWFLLPTLQSSRDDLFAYCLSVGYPLGDLLLLSGIAWMLLRGAWVNQWSIWLLSIALLVGLAADVLFGYQSVQGSFQSGGLADVAYMLSWTAFAWAGYAELARKPTLACE